MELKHQWNELQRNIILAAREELAKKGYQITSEVVIGIQCALQKFNVPFYEAWAYVDPHIKSLGCTNIHEIIIAQALGGCFAELMESPRGKAAQYSYFKEKLFGCTRETYFTHLPVRIPDNELNKAANTGDLPKIIYLYDTARTPGAKLKNIYHALLNNCNYPAIMTVNDMYGGLEQIDCEILQQHFLREIANENQGVEDFRTYYCQNIAKKYRCFWEDLSHYSSMPDLIGYALKAGVPVTWPIFKNDHLMITLKRYMYFLDELLDVLETPAQTIKSFPGRFSAHCQCVKTYMEWERTKKSSAREKKYEDE